MVKFSKELEAQLIPEWKDKFVNYWQLKKRIKMIKLRRGIPEPEVINPDFGFSIFDSVRYVLRKTATRLSGGGGGAEQHEIIQVHESHLPVMSSDSGHFGGTQFRSWLRHLILFLSPFWSFAAFDFWPVFSVIFSAAFAIRRGQCWSYNFSLRNSDALENVAFALRSASFLSLSAVSGIFFPFFLFCFPFPAISSKTPQKRGFFYGHTTASCYFFPFRPTRRTDVYIPYIVAFVGPTGGWTDLSRTFHRDPHCSLGRISMWTVPIGSLLIVQFERDISVHITSFSHPVKNRGGDEDETYETDLVQLVGEGDDKIKQFFEGLDEELNKVNHFHKTTESEFLERGEILRKQLQILLDLKQVIHDRRRKRSESQPRSNSSSVSRFDVSESVADSTEASAEGSPTDGAVAALERNGVSFVGLPRSKAKKGKPKTALRIEIPATTPTRAIMAVTSMLWEDLVNNRKKENPAEFITLRRIQCAEKMIRGAFVELYKGLGLLKTYRIASLLSSLNMLAFTKILKKFDKVIKYFFDSRL
ncbi:hypothetical protein ACLOJK_008016 [Asimina triloba]